MDVKEDKGVKKEGADKASEKLDVLQGRIQACKSALAEYDKRANPAVYERASTFIKLADFFFKSRNYRKAEEYTCSCEKVISSLPPKEKGKGIAIKSARNLEGYQEKLCEIEEVIVSYRLLGKEMGEVSELLGFAKKAYDMNDEKELKKMLDSASKRIYKELKKELPKILLSLESLDKDKSCNAYDILDEARVLFGLGNYVLSLTLAAQAHAKISESSAKEGKKEEKKEDDKKEISKGEKGLVEPKSEQKVDEKKSVISQTEKASQTREIEQKEKTDIEEKERTEEKKEKKIIKVTPVSGVDKVDKVDKVEVAKIKIIDKKKETKIDEHVQDKDDKKMVSETQMKTMDNGETKDIEKTKEVDEVKDVESGISEKGVVNEIEKEDDKDIVEKDKTMSENGRLSKLVMIERRLSTLAIPQLSDNVTFEDLCEQAKSLGFDLSEIESLLSKPEGELRKGVEPAGGIKKILKCAYCKGLIRFNAKYVECECGKVVHRECAKKRSRCPECQRTLTWDEHDQEDPRKLAYEKLMLVLRPYHKLLNRLHEAKMKIMEAKGIGFDVSSNISKLEEAVDKFTEKDYESTSEQCDMIIESLNREMEKRVLSKLNEVSSEITTLESLDVELKSAKEKLNNARRHVDEKKYAKAMELANSSLEDLRASASVKFTKMLGEVKETILQAETFGENLEIEKNEIIKAEYLEKQMRLSESLDVLQKIKERIMPIVSKKTFEILSACQGRLLKAQDGGVDVSVAEVSFMQAKKAYEIGDYRRAIELSKQTDDDLTNALTTLKTIEETKGRLRSAISPTLSQIEEAERLGVPIFDAKKMVSDLNDAVEKGDEKRAMEIKQKIDEIIEKNVIESAKATPETISQLLSDAKAVGIDTSWQDSLFDKLKSAVETDSYLTVLQHAKQIRTMVAESFHKRALELSQKLAEAVEDAERDGINVQQYSKKVKEVKEQITKKHYAVAAQNAYAALDAVREKHHEEMEKIYVRAMEALDVAREIGIDVTHEEKIIESTKGDYESGRVGPSKLLHESKHAVETMLESINKIFELKKKECVDELENARSYGLDLSAEDARLNEALKKFGENNGENKIKNIKGTLEELAKCKEMAIEKITSRIKERIEAVRGGLGNDEVHEEARKLLKLSEDALLSKEFEKAIELLKRAKARTEAVEVKSEKKVEKVEKEIEVEKKKEDTTEGKKESKEKEGKNKEDKKESEKEREPEFTVENLTKKLALTEQVVKRHAERGEDVEWANELIRFARLGIEMKEYKNANHFLNQIIEGLKDENKNN